MSMYIGQDKINKKNTSIIVGVILFFLLAIIMVGYLLFQRNQDSSEQLTQENSIDYSDPTKQEEDSSQDAKKRTAENQENTSEENDEFRGSDKRSVDIAISYAEVSSDDTLEVRAFMSGLMENSGTCSATLSIDGVPQLSASSSVFIDASSSICMPIYIDTSSLTPGEWSMYVSYISPESEGVSEEVRVDIR